MQWLSTFVSHYCCDIELEVQGFGVHCALQSVPVLRCDAATSLYVVYRIGCM
jgi:hypothetical protein